MCKIDTARNTWWSPECQRHASRLDLRFRRRRRRSEAPRGWAHAGGWENEVERERERETLGIMGAGSRVGEPSNSRHAAVCAARQSFTMSRWRSRCPAARCSTITLDVSQLYNRIFLFFQKSNDFCLETRRLQKGLQCKTNPAIVPSTFSRTTTKIDGNRRWPWVIGVSLFLFFSLALQ